MMKIFELRWAAQDEKEWIAAHTNIEALKVYESITDVSLVDMDDDDEIVELPKEKWAEYTVKTEGEPAVTFAEWMDGTVKPDIICGTMYDIDHDESD